MSNARPRGDGAGITVLRSDHDEGEVLPGAPPQPLVYGIDQLGSVRRVFASPTSAPALDYDPYGTPLQSTPPPTDYTYAGLFNHPASGLYLAQYRAYDPQTGRWLSRAPLGEHTDPAGNLYAYVAGNPVSSVDPEGRQLKIGPHALSRIMQRGLTPGQILDAFENGSRTCQPNGNIKCEGSSCVIIISPTDWLVTTWPK